MKVRVSRAAILVQRTGATVMPRLCCSIATSKRAKCISLTVPGSAEQAAQVGAVVAVAAESGRDELHQVGVAVAGGELHQAEPVAMRVEAHGLGIDRDDRAQRQAFRQVVPVQMDGAAWHELWCCSLCWCPGEDSNFHDLAATGTLKPARLPIPPPGQSCVPRRLRAQR